MYELVDIVSIFLLWGCLNPITLEYLLPFLPNQGLLFHGATSHKSSSFYSGTYVSPLSILNLSNILDPTIFTCLIQVKVFP